MYITLFLCPTLVIQRKRKTEKKKKRIVILSSEVSINQSILEIRSITLQYHVFEGGNFQE